MGQRCCVCDGQIENGRCRDCGMPYRRDEELYHLNENRRDHYRHVSEETREKLRKMEQPRDASAQSSAGAGRGKARKKDPARAARRKRVLRQFGSGQPRSGRRQGLTALVIVIAVLVLLPSIFSAVGSFLDGVQHGREGSYEEDLYEEELPVYEEPPVDTSGTLDEFGEAVEEQLSAGAEQPDAAAAEPEDAEPEDTEPEEQYTTGSFEGSLGAGEYVIGQEIPEGIYQISLEGEGAEMELNLTDYENGLFEFLVFTREASDASYIVESAEDLQLMEGGRLMLEGPGTLRFVCGEARYTENWAEKENPLTAEYTAEKEMTVGEDLEPGVYDIVLEDGEGDLMIEREEDSFYLLLSAEYAYATTEFQHIRLTEGTKLTLNDYGEGFGEPCRVLLRPSGQIYEAQS